jgi:hypothetical protein
MESNDKIEVLQRRTEGLEARLPLIEWARELVKVIFAFGQETLPDEVIAGQRAIAFSLGISEADWEDCLSACEEVSALCRISSPVERIIEDATLREGRIPTEAQRAQMTIWFKHNRERNRLKLAESEVCHIVLVELEQVEADWWIAHPSPLPTAEDAVELERNITKVKRLVGSGEEGRE